MKKSKLFPTLGLLTGVVMIILGFVVQGMDCGNWINSSRFGADFYTHISEATTRAANNIQEVGQMLRSCFTAFFICFGLMDICYFGCKIKEMEAPAMPVSAPTHQDENREV